MKQHRVVHVALRYPPATGGVETYVHELVERTRNLSEGRDVRVLTSAMRTHGPISDLAGEDLLDDPVYVQRLHHLATPFISYPRLQALSYYLGHHQPTIVEAYSFWYQPADVSARFAKKNHLPFIFHPMFYSNQNRKKPVWQLYKKFVGQTTFNNADVVVVISPFEQQLIEQQGFAVKRFELIPPGIDTTPFETPHINPFLKRGLKGNILLSVARLAPGKHVDEAVTAMPEILRQCPDTHLVLIGEDFGCEQDIKKQIATLGLEKNVHIWGKVSRAELVAAHQHATALIHPSEYEAFGITLGESLAAGRPVIARHVGAVPYVVEHNKSGLLFTTDTEMIEAVITLLKNSQLADNMGRQGQIYITNNFTWDKSIKKLTALYDELRSVTAI